jgi:hypothetical protein
MVMANVLIHAATLICRAYCSFCWCSLASYFLFTEKAKVAIRHTQSLHVLSSMGEAIDTLLINNVCCNAQRICLV